MTKYFRLLVVALLLTGCAAGDAIVDPSDSSRGMIVGAFDYSESEYIITAITLDPADRISIRAGGRGERVHLYNSGTFFADNLKPGRYAVNALYSGNVVFTPPKTLKMEATVRPGGISYIGTYKLKIKELKMFSRTGGSMARTDRNPDERKVLQSVRELVKDTGWRPKVEQRIAQLKRS